MEKEKNKISILVNSNIDFAVPIRTEIFENEPHLVVPAVILVEGVHNKLLYTRDDMQKFTESWNGMPLPVHHPQDTEGIPISANSPDLIQNRSVGRLFNVSYVVEDGKAKNKGELWININKANKIDPSILTAIYTGKLEVSTALYHDFEWKTGSWNEEDFIGITRNYRPNHLALLPGEIGACSWEDGCGAPRINQERKEDSLKNEKILSVNDTGIIDLKNKFRELLISKSQGSFSFWIQDVFPNEKYFIYEREEKKADGNWETKTYKRTYTQDGDAVDINDDAVEVREKRVFEEVTNNKQQEKEVIKIMVSEDRKKKVNALITNEKIPQFDESTREFLEGLNDCQFAKVEEVALLSANQAKEEKPGEKKEDGKAISINQESGKVIQTEGKKADGIEVETADLATLAKLGKLNQQGNQGLQVNKLDEYLNHAPAEIRELLTESVANLKRSKETLVGLITANQANIFSKEELLAKDIRTLEGMVRMMGGAIPENNTNFIGRGGGITPQQIQANIDDFKAPEMPKVFNIQ